MFRMVIILIVASLALATRADERVDAMMAALQMAQPIEHCSIVDMPAIASSSTDYSSLTGVWRTSGTDALFTIVSEPDKIFSMIVAIDMSDMRIAPGTIIGVATPTAKSDVYDALFYTSVDANGAMSQPQRFTINASSAGRIVITSASPQWRFALWRALPYMFRRGISRVSPRSEQLDGAVRIAPASIAARNIPRVL